MRTPYDTGKVKIGLYYEPPKYVEQDRDMIAIQGWFIGDNKAARRNYIANLCYIILLAVAVVLAIVYK
jgi:putative ubiquitin-RnfH superfamily antitoxin RatB of RatAB toxin-antitoxin module